MAEPDYAPKLAEAAFKIPPHSLEAEQAVLGGVLQDASRLDAIQSKLTVSDFYLAAHGSVYRCMVQLTDARKPIDVLMVAEALESQDRLEQVGGMAYLAELANNTPSASNVPAWADIIIDRAILRRLISVSNEIAESCFNPQGRSATDLLNDAEASIFGIGDTRPSLGGPEWIDKLLKNTVERIDALSKNSGPVTGLGTGFARLDELTTGLQPSDMIVIAARPSMGKTSLAMNIAERATIKVDKVVLVFSMEMPAESLIMRLLSSMSRVELRRIRTGQLEGADWPRITSSVRLLKDRKLFIDDTSALTPSDIRSRARRLVRESGPLGLMVVDYLQLMQVRGSPENRVGEISEISRSLKSIAREFECPLLALSQLNRSLEQRPDKRPVMSDLRESGAIEQDADVIMAIYRDEVYHPEDGDQGVAEVLLLKQRNGPIGRVKLAFLGQYTMFDNLVDDYGEGYDH